MKNSSKGKRILIFSPIFYPDIGGPAVQGRFLSEMLDENGYDVYVLKYGDQFETNVKIKVISLNWDAQPGIFGRIIRTIIGPTIVTSYILRIKPDIVFVNSVFWNGMVLSILCRMLKIPSILKFTGDWVFESTKGQKENAVAFDEVYSKSVIKRVMHVLEKTLINQFNIIWVISQFRYENVRSLVNKPEIWLQNNFHDLPKHDLIIRNRFESPYIFITTARLIPHKRINIIIEVFSTLPKDCKLVIIGDGSEFNTLRNLTRQLGISNRVAFLGKISSKLLYDLLASSTAYISWSAEEGAPNSFIEALNFGLPIISANVGGIPEMFDTKTVAVKLLNPDNQHELSTCLNHLITSPKIFEEMSKGAFLESSRFRKDTNKERFIQLFNQLVSDSKF